MLSGVSHLEKGGVKVHKPTYLSQHSPLPSLLYKYLMVRQRSESVSQM